MQNLFACVLSVQTSTVKFAVKWASESVFTLLLFPGLSQTDTYLSEMWQKCHIASGEWEKILHVSSVYSCSLVFNIYWFFNCLLFCLFS